MSYLKRHGTRRVPQWAPIPGSDQVPNSSGGFAWAVDDWTRLRRFLILGSEGGSYYASQWKLTRENAKTVERCVREDGKRAVAEIVRVSDEGRAPKNDPALFALALAAGLGDEETRKAALDALPQVARTGTHLFQFASFVEGFRGWGRSLRRAVGRWYAAQPVDALAYQAVKYRQRDGVTHRDLLRLAHPARHVSAGNPTLEVEPASMRACSSGSFAVARPTVCRDWSRASSVLSARRRRPRRRRSSASTACLARRSQTEHLTSPEVWEALLENMPMTAMVRNLATMTRVGVVAPASAGTAKVVAQLGDVDANPACASAPDRTARGAAHVPGRPRRSRPRRVEPGPRGRGRSRRRVLHGVRERRANGQANAARARRVRFDDRRFGRRRAAPHVRVTRRRRWRW